MRLNGRAVRDVFLKENIILGDWYDQLIRMVIEVSPASNTFIDFGCNAGHFCFSLKALGKRATGVDVWQECYEVISDITGMTFEYIQCRYNSATHEVPEFHQRTFDFGFPADLFPELIERLRGTPARLADLARLGPEVLTRRDDSTWSIQENVGHLADLESLFTGRLDDFAAGTDTLRPAATWRSPRPGPEYPAGARATPPRGPQESQTRRSAPSTARGWA